MKKILILCNGPFPDKKTLGFLVRQADEIVCCDGALDQALSKKIKTSLVIGDMDSVRTESLKLCREVIKNKDQNFTDLEKALNLIIGRKKKYSVLVAGATGGRTDFTLYNLHLLKKYRSMDLSLVDDSFIIRYADKPVVVKNTADKCLISLLPLGRTGKAESRGLKFPLAGRSLSPGGQESISNRKRAKIIRVDPKGPVLIFIEHRGSKTVLKGV